MTSKQERDTSRSRTLNTLARGLPGVKPGFIKYTKGYKYQLSETYKVYIPIYRPFDIQTQFISLTRFGLLIIHAGYAWDGPSGPTIDTPNFMRGSLVHDALYQLMRWELLPQNYRRRVDKILYDMCYEDNMSAFRASWVYRGLRVGGSLAADPSSRKKVYVAPRKKRATIKTSAQQP